MCAFAGCSKQTRFVSIEERDTALTLYSNIYTTLSRSVL